MGSSEKEQEVKHPIDKAIDLPLDAVIVSMIAKAEVDDVTKARHMEDSYVCRQHDSH